MYVLFKIKAPVIIESIILYFVLRYRKKRYGFAFRKIKLIGDKHTIVDPEDYYKLSQYVWQLFESCSKNYYAVRYDEYKFTKMHRVIMNAPKGVIVDHKDGNGLNNIKSNLRFATYAQNSFNKKTGKKGSSKYRGVRLIKEGKYRATINYNRIHKHLGYFDTEEEAARAYDEAAKIYHGEFAVLNFPQNDNGLASEANPLISACGG